jgi:carboxyl-terminal processing protease
MSQTEQMKIIQVALLSIFFTSSVFASPASELFREASFYLSFHYHGYSSVKPEELAKNLGTQLEQACQSKGESCGFSDARPYIERLAQGMRDGHTYYLSPSTYRTTLTQFSGINPNPNPLYGFSLGNPNSRNEIAVVDVVADSPAFKAGIRPFDRIVTANGNKIVDFTELRNTLNTNQPVKLEVLRGDSINPVRFETLVKRSPLKKTNLPYLYQPPNAPAGVIALRIPTFVGSNDIAPKVHELVAKAKAQNAKIIIVDLRNNGGGEETECYGAASAFIGRAVNINETRLSQINVGFDGGTFIGNDPKDLMRYEIKNPTLWTGSVSVLVNSATASCGELFAYLIQRAKRGQIIGESTTGVLDTATEFWQLADQSALAITYVRTLNPDGTRVPERVTPDINTRDDTNTAFETGHDPLFEQAYQLP